MQPVTRIYPIAYFYNIVIRTGTYLLFDLLHNKQTVTYINGDAYSIDSIIA